MLLGPSGPGLQPVRGPPLPTQVPVQPRHILTNRISPGIVSTWAGRRHRFLAGRALGLGVCASAGGAPGFGRHRSGVAEGGSASQAIVPEGGGCHPHETLIDHGGVRGLGLGTLLRRGRPGPGPE